MNFIDFVNEFGIQTIGSFFGIIVTAIATILVAKFTKKSEDKDREKAIKAVVKTVVKATEQMFTTLSGSEKLEKAIESATEMLANKGINTSELELRMAIESTLADLNKVFEKANEKGEETSSYYWDEDEAKTAEEVTFSAPDEAETDSEE